MMNRVSDVVSRNSHVSTAFKPVPKAIQPAVAMTSPNTVRFSGLSGRTGRATFLALALMPLVALVGCSPNSAEKATIQQVDQSTQNEQQAKLLSTMLRGNGTWKGRTEALKRFNMLNQPASVKIPAYLAVAEQLYEKTSHMNTDEYETAKYLHTGLLAVARQADTPKEHASTITAFVANIPLVNPSNNNIETASDEYKTLKASLQKAFPAPVE